MSEQQKFLFMDGHSETASANTVTHSEDVLIDEIRATWRIHFLRQKVRVALRDCAVDEMNGFLEITSPLPDYPFDPATPLHLRIDNVTFTNAQITSCVIL